ncbi:hypothetical protein CLV40_104163 [Actinokineospora auranticolor]|uniref:Uncharacterized protein n=1 Tax=Actinokineospora auranticolor TaxID=155976 RepID=A0A2S6GUP8_9PSEU|nr:hypothetical protein CLV40_104163 [Actinokineospora auranticolor]
MIPHPPEPHSPSRPGRFAPPPRRAESTSRRHVPARPSTARAALAHPVQAASQPFPAPPRQAEPATRRRVPARPPPNSSRSCSLLDGVERLCVGGRTCQARLRVGWACPSHRFAPPQVRRGPAQRRFTPSSTARFSRSDHGRTGPRRVDRYSPHAADQTPAGPGPSVQPHAKNKGGLDRANLLCAGPLRTCGGAKRWEGQAHPTRRRAWQVRPPTQSKSTQSRRIAGARCVLWGLGSSGGRGGGWGEMCGVEAGIPQQSWRWPGRNALGRGLKSCGGCEGGWREKSIGRAGLLR